MIEWIAVILYGIIEGLTEFLPVSSTGHLLLAQRLLSEEAGLAGQSDLFNTVIQCGAVLAVLVLFMKRAKQLVLESHEPATRDYQLKLAVAFLITGVGGIALKKAGLAFPETAGPVAWASLVGGLVILAVEHRVKARPASVNVSWVCAVVVGLAQLVAAGFPGTSRSGATILVAMVAGTSRIAATEFSFLLGIPTLISAGALQVFIAWRRAHSLGVPMAENWGHLAVAGVIAAATAFLAVKWLLHFVQTRTFVCFGWYRIVLGLLILFLLR
jgi:undecaprenyl-diphosphatase